ncbi:MAG TPA: MFS transporter [Ramlibacter sp.]|uniref:MFS transporter n=1 Tax=Ramlibacter sp. TaxID=1917967 RepID=UPI002B53D295|nr:MFS transporter [Ramlibacter sp.]HVZ45798.1 MFS transporter [Ramlibacter sp.]
MNASSVTVAAVPVWTPLAVAAFRGVWVAGTLFYIGNAMLNMAASWLMIEMTGSPFLSALVQTASFLPMFLLSLPAGVLADTADRVRLVSWVLGAYALLAAAFSALALGGLIGPAAVLAFTFTLGMCSALQTPSANAVGIDQVPPSLLAPSVTLIAMAFNAARAVGPALAGLLFAAVGGGAVFAVGVFTAVGLMAAVHRWPPPELTGQRLPPERMWNGIVTGLRYARHAPAIRSHLVRTVAFAISGASVWALAPAVAQRLGLGATGYGLLMACMGSGAVTGGFFTGLLRARIGLERLTRACTMTFAVTILVCAFFGQREVVFPALFVGGAAWIGITASLNAAAQTGAPRWVRARVGSMHTVAALGSFAIGSAAWGALSSLVGVDGALVVSSAALVLTLLASRWFPLSVGAQEDAALAAPWAGLFVLREPEADAGPVAVEIAYHVADADVDDFLRTVRELSSFRRRDGAYFCRIYRDLGNPSRFVERFIVASWADHLRWRARATVRATALEERARQFQIRGEPVTTHCYLAQ